MTQKTKLPEFYGKPVIEKPKDVPQADFLSGDFGRAVFEEYKERTNIDYDNLSALDVLSYSEGIVQGSNPFVVVLINSIVQEEGLRTATPSDLERISRLGVLQLQGYYEDLALVLRTAGDSYKQNDYLAKNLAKQLKSRGKIKLPVMIPLAGFDLIRDENSGYGLRFNIKEDTGIVYAPVLNPAGNFSSEDINKETGLPKKTGNGSMSLLTREDGLSVLCRDGDLYLSAGDEDFVSSDSVGRVVVVKNFP
jgi:hypothetical protein